MVKMLIGAALVITASSIVSLALDGYMFRVQSQIKNASVENKLLPLVKIGQMAEVSGVIEHASIGFVLGNSVVDPSPVQAGNGDEFFSNVVSQCTFHSEQDFGPLCVICKLKDSRGNLVAQGIVGENFDQGDYVGSSTIHIDLEPHPDNPLSNEVQMVHSVEVRVCGPPGDGCTPEFWKQEKHFEFWPDLSLSPSTKFSDIFDEQITINVKIADSEETVTDPNLFQALHAQGPGIESLVRHTVAAFLNAETLQYAFSTAQVIAAFQVAFNSGVSEIIEDQKNIFDLENNRGCPFGNTPQGLDESSLTETDGVELESNSGGSLAP